MYGRYALAGPRSLMREERRYCDGQEQIPTRYNVAPTQIIPLARLVEGDRWA